MGGAPIPHGGRDYRTPARDFSGFAARESQSYVVCNGIRRLAVMLKWLVVGALALLASI
jgi:hypothetical protein